MTFTAALADRLAALAGLSLAEGEAVAIAHELSRRRDRLGALDDLDAHSIDIPIHSRPAENLLRPDTALPSSPREALFSGGLHCGAVPVPHVME